MKILFVGTLPPHPGGTAEVGLQVLNGLARLGHECRAIASITEQTKGYDEQWGGEIACAVNRYVLPEFILSTDVVFRSPAGGETERRALEPLLSRALADAPDAIILGREAFVLHLAAVPAAQAFPRLVICHHTGLPGALRDGLYPDSVCRELLGQMRTSSCLVAVAEHIAAGWRRLGLENVRTIANAVDGGVFSPRAKNAALLRTLDIAVDDVVVLHLSNLKPLKRVGDLIDSAARALQANARLLYVIVGDGPERGELEQACRRHKIAGRFRFTGWVPRRDVPDYLNLADMVVLPSALEGLPLVMLEAQACARLVLASDIAGARELIHHGQTGLLFPAGDVADLADQTLRATADPQLRADIGRRARQQAEGRSLQAMVGAYEQAFREVIAGARESRA
jgi:glycosyltransferase involved in cell wall biosynthesis